MCVSIMCIFATPSRTGVVQAFDEAWKLDKANCARYFR